MAAAAPRGLGAAPGAGLLSAAGRTPGGRTRGSFAAARAGNDEPESLVERGIAIIPYLLPLMDGVRYGRFFFREFPQVAALLVPLNPLLMWYYSVRWASIAVFFGLYYGICNNMNLSRYVRFNCMQCILLDILLIIPSLLENLVPMPTGGQALQVYIGAYNFIWLFVFVSVIYGVASCLLGQTARIPGVADAADQQTPDY